MASQAAGRARGLGKGARARIACVQPHVGERLGVTPVSAMKARADAPQVANLEQPLCVTSELSEYTSRCMNRIDEVRGFDSLGGRRLACGINAVDREQYHRRHARPAPFRRMDLAAAQHFRAEWIRDVEKGVGRGMGEA